MKTRQERIETGPPTQEQYEGLVDEMADLRRRKVTLYGETRYHDPDASHALLLTYADIYRKVVRIKNAVMSDNWDTGIEERDALRDAFLDLGNYALMGAQLLDLYQKQKAAPPKELPGGMPPFDQVAFWVKDPATFVHILKDLFGVSPNSDWAWDTVHSTGQVWSATSPEGPIDADQTANLRFNYSLLKGGLELEILRYDTGDPNWLATRRFRSDKDKDEWRPQLSHLGIHVEDLEDASARLARFPVVQDVITDSHTNPAIKDNRRYHYRIFDTYDALGFDIKLIQRLPYTPPEETDDAGPQDLE